MVSLYISVDYTTVCQPSSEKRATPFQATFDPSITQKLLDLHTWNFACLIRPTGTPRIPNLMNKPVIVLELLRPEKCHF